jgi:hypothetical protein
LPRLLLHEFVTDVQPTNAIVEAPGKFGQRGRRNPEQRLDLLPRQFGPDVETGFNWILKKRFAESGIRHQPPQGPLNTALTHGFTVVSLSLMVTLMAKRRDSLIAGHAPRVESVITY